MNIEELANSRKDDLLACKTPQELASLLKEEGVELTDEQLEAVAGGAGEGWSPETFAELLSRDLPGLFPQGFDPKSIWGNLPMGGTH